MKRKILQDPDKILREISQPVSTEEISGSEIKKLIQDMKDTVDSEEDGIALSAIQIGVPKRIFIVSPRAFEEAGLKKPEEHLIFINPQIIKQSKKTQWLEEGCLSVRGIYGEVNRPNQVTVEALDQDGQKFLRGAGGLIAQVLQHEYDHLEGILFIDKAKNLKKYVNSSVLKV